MTKSIDDKLDEFFTGKRKFFWLGAILGVFGLSYGISELFSKYGSSRLPSPVREYDKNKDSYLSGEELKSLMKEYRIEKK